MIIFCVDSLDPRLIIRIKSFLDKGESVEVYTYNKHQFTKSTTRHAHISRLNYGILKSARAIYISGNRSLLHLLLRITFLKYINKKTIILEIPDLPLRASNKFVNVCLSTLLNIIITLTIDLIVVTSVGFRKKLSTTKPIFEIQNSNHLGKCNFDAIEVVKVSKDTTFGFLGVYRYLEQQELLIKYSNEHKVNIKYFGGPPNARNELQKLAVNAPLVQINGDFSMSDLAKLHNEFDVIYAVYDAKQENVKLALPNKLYESLTYKKPLIVSKGTYLSKVVEDYGIGISVSSEDYHEFVNDIEKLYNTTFRFNPEIIKKINLQNQINFNFLYDAI